MKLLLPLVLLAASSSRAAWVIEDIPTQIEFVNVVGFTVGTEIATAYRPIYDANGVKTSNDLTIVYRTKSLWVAQRRSGVWSTIKLDGNGRYPSLALDSQGKPHITYSRTSDNRTYYARPMQVNSGNCGPNASWACDGLPTAETKTGVHTYPTGLSAITISGNQVDIVAAVPIDNGWNDSYFYRFRKLVASANWDEVAHASGALGPSTELSYVVNPQGKGRILRRDSEWMRWSYQKPPYSSWEILPPLYGHGGAFTLSSNDSLRLCYRDEAANRLIYATAAVATRHTDGSPVYADSWNETVIDYNIGDQGNCAIAIAPDNGIQPTGYYEPRIAFFDEPSRSIKFATRQPVSLFPPSLEWNIQGVAPATAAKKISLYLDKQGRPTIIYFDGDAWKLRLARWQ